MPERGPALLAGGRFHEAAAAFQETLKEQPGSVPVRIGLARAHVGAGDLLTATAWLSDALRLAPGQPDAMQMLADLLLTRQEYAQALPLYQQLLAPPHRRTPANLLHAGFCLEHTGQVEPAAALYAEATQAQAGFVEAEVDLAGVLWRLEDFDGSLRHAQRAVDLAPQHPFAQRILGTSYLNLNRLDEGERHLRQALELQPGMALAQLDLAFLLLLAGRLEEGWPAYEHRWRDAARLPRPPFYRAASEWPGPQVDLRGKAVAVYAEQGLGDVVQFVRYLPRLQAIGATVCCVVPPELVDLLEASFPGVVCLTPQRQLTVQAHVALLELPGRFGTTVATIPAEVPYLHPGAADRARWRQQLAPWDGKLKVGLAWSGSLVQVNNRNRAIPLSTLLPLTQLPGVQCFSLQKGDAGAFRDATPDAGALVDFTGAWTDMNDSAAMIAELDLVITVDTSIAHIAGALGRPVWVMLPPNADWRWLLEREDSPWYPSARLFRRDFGEAREAQVGRVLSALQGFQAG
jgi:tetratricopeptide (TPR) repeat protein